MLSVLHPKFSGMLGEALDVAARWSGDVVSTYVTNIFPVFFFVLSWFLGFLLYFYFFFLLVFGQQGERSVVH